MSFLSLGQTFCGNEQINFLWLFDLSTAPPLLYYSYVPIVVASMLIGGYVFFHNRRSLQARLLFTVSCFFALWVADILVEWIASYHTVLMYSWQLTALFEVGLYFSVFYFAHVFFFKEDLPYYIKLGLALCAIGIMATISTTLNIESYDVANCQGNNGVLWELIYAFEPAIIVLTVLMGIRAYGKEEDPSYKYQILIVNIGLAFFLTTFFLSNYYGEITKIYEFNFWGPLGMFLFIVLLGYIIVSYKAFNVKLLGAQALVTITALLVGSELFFVHSVVNQWLVGITLFLVAIFGYILVRSVKREVEQREKIEKLAGELQETNERQEGLIRFISHEVKNFLAKDMGAFATLAEGDLGPLPEKMQPFVETALKESRNSVDSTMQILKAANQKKGTVTYQKAPFDLAEAVKAVVEKLHASAEAKHLELSLVVDPSGAPYTFAGDKGELADHVFANLISNSINYTPTGSISVSLKKEGGTYVFTVADTGIGISEEDKQRLFTEGGHGKDSQRINVHSTGYGLYIAKNIVLAHGGSVRAESEGAGKGSRFIVELPA